MITRVLSDGQLDEIRDTTERILEDTGVKVMHDEALAVFRKAGAKVSDSSGTVRLPRSLLRELLSHAPGTCSLTGVDGIARTVGDGQQWGWGIVTDPWIVDYNTRQPRRPRLEDVRRNTSINQQLDFVLGMSCMDFPVSDVPGPHSNLVALQENLLNHVKHQGIYATSLESLKQWLRIGRVLTRGGELRGSRLFSVAVPSLSPMTITGMNVEFLKIACAYGFAVIPTVCPTAGMTSPFSLAGTLTMGNAEILFIAAMTQLYRRGNPIIYSFGPAVGDMQNGACLYYTIDKALWKIAHVQLGKSYRLPVVAESGGAMTHHFDQQSGAEGMLFMLGAVLSGAHILAGFGSTLNAVGHSTEMMLIQEEYFRAAQFLARGMRTDAEHRAEEAIARVGAGGEYITDDLTLKYMRGGEFFSSDLFDQTGKIGEGPWLLDRAHAKGEALVADFRSPVPEDIQEGLRRFFHDEMAAP